MNEKFSKAERSFYSLYSFGCHPGGFQPLLCMDIYKKFSQSIFYYGLEVCFLNKGQIIKSKFMAKRPLVFQNFHICLGVGLLPT